MRTLSRNKISLAVPMPCVVQIMRCCVILGILAGHSAHAFGQLWAEVAQRLSVQDQRT